MQDTFKETEDNADFAVLHSNHLRPDLVHFYSLHHTDFPSIQRKCQRLCSVSQAKEVKEPLQPPKVRTDLLTSSHFLHRLQLIVLFRQLLFNAAQAPTHARAECCRRL